MMRGRGEAKYRRGASPGRWENDRVRNIVGSPGSSRSPSRSRSPPPRRGPPQQLRGPVPPRKDVPVSRPGRSYSSSGSSPSRGNSPSSSSSEGAKPVTKKAPPLPGAYKKEILQRKKKEKEILLRLQAAEEELNTERANREVLQAKAEFLGEKVKTVAERSKNRGQMLVRLIQSFRQVAEAKSRLSEAEVELDSVLEAATALMQNEEQTSRPPDASVVKTEPTANAEAAAANPQRQQNQWTASVPATSQPQPPPPESNDVKMTDDGGKWTEAVEADGSMPGPKNMRSFKFNIKLPS